MCVCLMCRSFKVPTFLVSSPVSSRKIPVRGHNFPQPFFIPTPNADDHKMEHTVWNQAMKRQASSPETNRNDEAEYDAKSMSKIKAPSARNTTTLSCLSQYASQRYISPRLFLATVVLMAFLFYGRSSSSSNEEGYIVIIDAGSSGSRAHVFHYHSFTVVDPQHASFKAKPGLSSYASHPADAGSSMLPLIDFAKKHVPAEFVKKTRIVLKATAGMRLLDTDAERQAILASVTQTLRTSGFVVDHAQVMSGQEEGMLGWLAVNYLNKESQEWTVLEMGGASVQFTMPLQQSSSAAVPEQHTLSFRVPAKAKNGLVYTHSFLGLGMQSARQAVNEALINAGATEDPCLPRNYKEEHARDEYSGVASISAAGDFDACSALIQKTLFPKKAECAYPTGCFYDGVFRPPIKDTTLFWAFENFFYTTSALGIKGIPGPMILRDFIAAGQRVCAMEWPQVETAYPKDGQPKDCNEKWCFGSAYMYLLFTQGFGLSPDQDVTMGNSVGENGIDWALGAALQAVLETNSGGLRSAS